MSQTVWDEIFCDVINVLGDYISGKGGFKQLTDYRQKDIEEIHKIFFELNPVRLIEKLLNYVENSMRGFFSTLRSDLKTVLTQDKYAESNIIYRMLVDMKHENKKSNAGVWYTAAKKLEFNFSKTQAEFADLKADYLAVKKDLRLVCRENEEKDKKIEEYEKVLKLSNDTPALITKVADLEKAIKHQKDYLEDLERGFTLKAQEAQRLAKENAELISTQNGLMHTISIQKNEIDVLKKEIELLRELSNANNATYNTQAFHKQSLN